jgi:hypothetical protein
MANKKTKNSPEYVWELLAPRVNHLFGAFPSLNAAYNAACKLYEPDDRVNETKKSKFEQNNLDRTLANVV